MKKNTLKNVMCLHMLKNCEFENHMKIYANANCKKLSCMKRQNIAKGVATLKELVKL